MTVQQWSTQIVGELNWFIDEFLKATQKISGHI